VRAPFTCDFCGVPLKREYLRQPHSLDEIASHRFIYRPQDPVPFAEAVERRSMGQHLDRLLQNGRLREVAPGRYLS